MTPKKTLSDQQRRRYVACKKVISEKLPYCFEVGLALKEIKDDNLFVEDFDTFPEFALEIYGIAQAHAYRLIEAAEVKDSVSHSPIGEKITNEAQARALAKVPEKERVKVLEQVAEKGDVTAKAIEETYEPTEPEGMNEPPPIPKDKMGFPLTEEIIPLWNRGEEEILALISHLSKSKKEIKDAHDKSDPLYHGFDCQGWVNDLSLVIHMLKCHRPYAVCPVCNGRMCKRCACCKGRGFVGKAYWEGPSVFVEMRTMRELQIAKANEA